MSAAGPQRASTGRTDWRTPPDLFGLLHEEFQFTLDGAASGPNLLPRFYSIDGTNAFDAKPSGETIFLNPPYGRGLPRWAELSCRWGDDGNTVVVLVPGSTDTRWFHSLWEYASEVRLLTPRVGFIDSETGLPKKDNPSGSALFVLRPWRWQLRDGVPCLDYTRVSPRVSTWEWDR